MDGKTKSKGGRPSIYALCDPWTGELRYIGKASSPSARLATHIRDSRRSNRPVCAWVAKCLSEGKVPEMIVLAENCEDWQRKEKHLISRARELGHRILNLADGGDSPPIPSASVLRTAAISAKESMDIPALRAYWAMMRALGVVAKAWERRHDKSEALHMVRETQRRLAGLKGSRREKAGLRFAESNPWAFGEI